MNPEQKFGHNVQEETITNESVKEVAPIEVISEEDKQVQDEIKDQKEKENNKEITKKREEIMQQLGGIESKEEYPEGHILNSNILDKIAQLEAIDKDSLEFNQEKYDQFIEEEKNGTSGPVIGNQEKIKRFVEEGDDLESSLSEADVMYGIGGWNRYVVDADTGMVKLDSGKSATNSTGDRSYFNALKAKAKELGMDI